MSEEKVEEVTHDFDKAQKERKGEKLTFKKAGRIYELPPSPPSSLVFDTLSVAEDYTAGEELPMKAMMHIFEETLGEEQFQQLKNDTKWRELEEIFEWVWTQWMGKKGEDDQGKDSQSSKTGSQSSQTSSESTEST